MGPGLIRIVLVVSVLITHSIYSAALTIPEAIAVKLFHIISGFCMAMILRKKYACHRSLFYRNRFPRLGYPPKITIAALIFHFGAAPIFVNGPTINSSFAIFNDYQVSLLSLSACVFLLSAPDGLLIGRCCPLASRNPVRAQG